jgi:predicted DNA-binding antitoxin AbrB/MazE fold protein
MNQVVEAIFEDGAFRILDAPGLPLSEGQRVRLHIETSSATPEELLDLAAEVYAGLSQKDIDEIERIAVTGF